jgi:hypothetical protein
MWDRLSSSVGTQLVNGEPPFPRTEQQHTLSSPSCLLSLPLSTSRCLPQWHPTCSDESKTRYTLLRPQKHRRWTTPLPIWDTITPHPRLHLAFLPLLKSRAPTLHIPEDRSSHQMINRRPHLPRPRSTASRLGPCQSRAQDGANLPFRPRPLVLICPRKPLCESAFLKFRC